MFKPKYNHFVSEVNIYCSSTHSTQQERVCLSSFFSPGQVVKYGQPDPWLPGPARPGDTTAADLTTSSVRSIFCTTEPSRSAPSLLSSRTMSTRNQSSRSSWCCTTSSCTDSRNRPNTWPDGSHAASQGSRQFRHAAGLYRPGV